MDKSSIEREVSSAKQLAYRYDNAQAIEALQQTQSEARYCAIKEKEEIETARYEENKKLSITALRIAIISAVTGFISIIFSAITLFNSK